MQSNLRDERAGSREYSQSSAPTQTRRHQSPVAQMHSTGDVSSPLTLFPVIDSSSLVTTGRKTGDEVLPPSGFVSISHGSPTKFNVNPSSSQVFTTSVESVASSTSTFLQPKMLPSNSAIRRPTMLISNHLLSLATTQANPVAISSPINKVMKTEYSKTLPPDEILVASSFGDPQCNRFIARPSSHDTNIPQIRSSEPLAHVERFLAPSLTRVMNSTGIYVPSTSKHVSSESKQTKVEKSERTSSSDYYARKQFLLKKSVKSLVLKNAALCDEVSRLNQRIQTVADERKILLKRLLNFEKAKEKRRSSSTTLKKATKSSFVLQIPIPSIDQQVNSANVSVNESELNRILQKTS